MSHNIFLSSQGRAPAASLHAALLQGVGRLVLFNAVPGHVLQLRVSQRLVLRSQARVPALLDESLLFDIFILLFLFL